VTPHSRRCPTAIKTSTEPWSRNRDDENLRIAPENRQGRSLESGHRASALIAVKRLRTTDSSARRMGSQAEVARGRQPGPRSAASFTDVVASDAGFIGRDLSADQPSLIGQRASSAHPPPPEPISSWILVSQRPNGKTVKVDAVVG